MSGLDKLTRRVIVLAVAVMSLSRRIGERKNDIRSQRASLVFKYRMPRLKLEDSERHFARYLKKRWASAIRGRRNVS